MPKHTPCCLALASLFLFTSLSTAQPAIKRLPTAALIDRDGGVVAGLLEARLLDKGDAKWLERNEIERVLQEQRLDAAFGAAGGKERLALGKLLKADLLVMVRRVDSPQEKGQELLECVVCETRQGLRLKIAYARHGQDEESAAETFGAAFATAVRKYDETVREIVAVPPLVSDNLSFDKNYLQAAYAKLIEQELLDQSGVVVVELGEAQSIAREAAVSAEDRPLQRDRLPVYLLGNFRHSGAGDGMRVAIDLRLSRGDKPLGERSTNGLSTEEVGSWLADAALELLEETRTVAVSKTSPKAESQQLAARAREFFRIGNWEESLALMEASLLLEPKQQQLHHDAVVACGELIQRLLPYREQRKPRVATAVAIYRRGLEHLEAFARTAESLEKYREEGQTNFVARFEGSTNGWNMHPATPADAREIITEMLPVRRDTYLRIARFRFAAGFKDEFWLGTALQRLPPEEQFALASRLLEEFKEHPDLQQFGVHMALCVGNGESAEYQQFLDGLASSKSESVRKVAENTRAQLAQMEANRQLREKMRPPEITEVAKEILPTPISLSLRGEKLTGPQLPLGCVPAGPGRDVFFGNGILYLMRKRGDLEVLWRSKELACDPRSMAYDGRYFWASFFRFHRSPGLLVVDLEKGKITEFTQDDGLPGDDSEHDLAAPYEYVRIAPLEPGRVCLAGSLGRAWIGIATFDGVKKSLKIIHEAREAANNADPKQGERTSVAFQTTLALTLVENHAGKLAQKVVVPRLTENLSARQRPLLVDFPGEKVRVASFPLWAEGEETRRQPEAFTAVVDGRLLVAAFNIKLGAPELLSVAASDGKASVVYEDPPDGFYAAPGSELHILGKQWWIFDTKTRKLRVAASPVPWLFENRWVREGAPVSFPAKHGPDDYRLERVHTSSHYGVIAFTMASKDRWQLLEGVRVK